MKMVAKEKQAKGKKTRNRKQRAHCKIGFSLRTLFYNIDNQMVRKTYTYHASKRHQCYRDDFESD